jgi:hypothetical protein
MESFRYFCYSVARELSSCQLLSYPSLVGCLDYNEVLSIIAFEQKISRILQQTLGIMFDHAYKVHTLLNF